VEARIWQNSGAERVAERGMTVMARITNNQDAYGRLIHDYYNGCRGLEIDERGDGYIAVGSTPGVYFAEYKDWPPF